MYRKKMEEGSVVSVAELIFWGSPGAVPRLCLCNIWSHIVPEPRAYTNAVKAAEQHAADEEACHHHYRTAYWAVTHQLSHHAQARPAEMYAPPRNVETSQQPRYSSRSVEVIRSKRSESKNKSIQSHCGKVQYSFCFAMAFCATRYPNIAGTLEIRGGTKRTEGGFLALHWFHFRPRKKMSEVMKAGGLDVQEPSEEKMSQTILCCTLPGYIWSLHGFLLIQQGFAVPNHNFDAKRWNCIKVRRYVSFFFFAQMHTIQKGITVSLLFGGGAVP